MRVISLVYAAFAAITTVNGQCAEGEWEVSLLGSGTVYCVGSQPCSGLYNGNDQIGKYSCPQQGQPNIDGTVTLDKSTCCGLMGGNTLGCVVKTPGAVCKGPEPAPYSPKPKPSPTTTGVTPSPTTTSSVTPSPTDSVTPSATTLTPEETTTLAPNATTLAPNSTTLEPNSTTLTPSTTTNKPNGTDPGNILTPAPGSKSPLTPPTSNDKTNSPDGTDGSSGISTGAIIGIIAGVLALALLVGLVLFRKKQPPQSYMASPVEGSAMGAATAGLVAGEVEVEEALTPRQHVTLL